MGVWECGRVRKGEEIGGWCMCGDRGRGRDEPETHESACVRISVWGRPTGGRRKDSICVYSCRKIATGHCMYTSVYTSKYGGRVYERR